MAVRCFASAPRLRSVTGLIALVNVLYYLLNLLFGEDVESKFFVPLFSVAWDSAEPLALSLVTFFTHSYVEVRIASLSVCVGGLLAFGVSTELDMGHRATLQYLVVVCTVTALLVIIMMGVAVSSDSYLHGAWPAVEAMAVAQCYTRGLGTVVWPLPPPEEGATAPSRWRRGAAKVRARHLPCLLVAAALVCDVTMLTSSVTFRCPQSLTCVVAAVVGWLYLRLSWSNVGSVTLFPLSALCTMPPIPRQVETCVNRLFGRSVFAGGSAREESDSGEAIAPVLFTANRVSGQVLLPGSTPEEAERRRAIALAALARRLQEQKPQQEKGKEESEPVAHLSLEA